MLNSFKIELIKFPDERGYSMKATEPIERGDHILAVTQKVCITSFDPYPWKHLFEGADEQVSMMGRLVYERFTRFAPDDISNLYVQTLPSEVTSPLLWSEEDVEYLVSLDERRWDMKMPIPFDESYTKFQEALSK